MSKTHRLLWAGTLIVSLFSPHAPLFAAEPATSAAPAPAFEYRPAVARTSIPGTPAIASPFAVSNEALLATLPSDFDAAAQRGYRGRRARNRGGRQASAVAMAIGAVASITGTALLV